MRGQRFSQLSELQACAVPVLLCIAAGCGDSEPPPSDEAPLVCAWEGAGRPVALSTIGCPEDFAALAAAPLDTSLPGASSVKLIIDRASLDPRPAGQDCTPACMSPATCAGAQGKAVCADFALYFQDTEARALHHAFATEFLSGTCACSAECSADCACDTDASCSAGCACDADCACACATIARRCTLPYVADLSTFNRTEYLLPSRRFLLGAVTHYEAAGVFALELAPVDTAPSEMIEQIFRLVAARTFFGDSLVFLPTSVAQEERAASLPSDIPVVTAADLYGNLAFQPLNLGSSIGQVRILAATALPQIYVSPRELLVVDSVPNDITPVAGLITGTFQTPLSHVNILSQNRGTPNMALRGAPERPEIQALAGRWARLTVGANAWSLVEVSAEEAEAWWDSRQPPDLDIPAMDLSVAALVDLEQADLTWVPSIGAKAANLAELQRVGFPGTAEGFDRAGDAGGLPQGWTSTGGSWAVTPDANAPSGSAVLAQTAGNATASAALAAPHWRNFDCRVVVMPSPTGAAGLAALVEPSGAHLRARLSPSELALEAVDATGGVALLASTPLSGTTAPIEVALRVHDREVRAGAAGAILRWLLPEHPPGTSCGVWAGDVARFDDFEVAPIYGPRGFAIPFAFFRAFMADNGFDDALAGLLADPDFLADAAVRREALTQLRSDMLGAPLPTDLETLLDAKLAADFPDTRMRFRSSTNAEDLGSYSGAGLYTSRSGDPRDPTRPVDVAIKTVWASLFSQRAFEEREVMGIPHQAVGMAVLVHRSYPNELANGVAITRNIFDATTPAFYVNVQAGEVSVTNPPPGILPDQFLYYWAAPAPTTAYLSHSTLMDGEPVMSPSEVVELGRALLALHEHFRTLYEGRPLFAMDVELKLDEPDRALVIKQGRPYPGRGE